MSSVDNYPTFADELRTLKKRKRDENNNDGINPALINVRNALCADCTKAALEDESELVIEVGNDEDYENVEVCDFVELTKKLGLKLRGKVSDYKWTVSWPVVPSPPLPKQGFTFGATQHQ